MNALGPMLPLDVQRRMSGMQRKRSVVFGVGISAIGQELPIRNDRFSPSVRGNSLGPGSGKIDDCDVASTKARSDHAGTSSLGGQSHLERIGEGRLALVGAFRLNRANSLSLECVC